MSEFLIQHELWAAMAVLLLAFAATACATRYTVHPGSLNKADSVAYDTLLIAEKSIDEAKTSNPGAALNTLIQAYNVARNSWLTYRGALATNTPADTYLQQLNSNLLDLENAIQALEEVKP
jgi:hypothetical protein